jgi:hypothetical protein
MDQNVPLSPGRLTYKREPERVGWFGLLALPIALILVLRSVIDVVETSIQADREHDLA